MPSVPAAVIAGYVAVHFAVQRLVRTPYSLLPLSQLDDGVGHTIPNPAAGTGKAAGSPAPVAAAAVAGDGCGERVFSREASLQDKQLVQAECGGGGSRGGSFTAGMRQQGSMHMRSDSANHDSVRVGSLRRKPCVSTKCAAVCVPSMLCTIQGPSGRSCHNVGAPVLPAGDVTLLGTPIAGTATASDAVAV